MTDTPAPVFDANGWCHDMSAAPKDVKDLLLWRCDDFGIGGWNPDKYNKYPQPYWECSRGRVWGKIWEKKNHPTAWRYAPAPPVGEK